MSIFDKKNFEIQSGSRDLIKAVDDHLKGQGPIRPEIGQFALSTESLDPTKATSLNTSLEALKNTVINAARMLKGFSGTVFPTTQFAKESHRIEANALTSYQVDAAVAAGVLASNPQAFFQASKPGVIPETANTSVVMNFGLEDALQERSLVFEAYDERENRQAAAYSITYNLKSAQQDEFAETFFPTIVVTPDNAGFIISVRLLTVYNEFLRNVNGAQDQYNKKNLIRAVADPTILKNDLTKITPVARYFDPGDATATPPVLPSYTDAEIATKLVDPTLIAPYDVVVEGETITTAPLRAGSRIGILALSQTETLIHNGNLDQTDSLDPTVKVTNVYVKFPGAGNAKDVMVFKVDGLPFANFVYSVQRNYRDMVLNFDTTSLVLTKDSKDIANANPVVLAAIRTSNLTVRVSMALNGRVNIETGDLEVFGNRIEIYSVHDSAGVQLAPTNGTVSALTTLFSNAVIVGYDVEAWRTNINRRQRGQLIDRTLWNQAYNVPLRGPITSLHPVTSDTTTDGADLDALITATRIRTSQAAVRTLLATDEFLATYNPVPDAAGVGPDVLGIGRFFVKPQYQTKAINLKDYVANLTSTQNPEDVRAALINQIRIMVYTLYRDSEYKAAADALAGGVAPVPRVIIGTDPVIAGYLMVTGDLRTIGNDFDVTIVSTLNYGIKGKIFITFGVFDDTRNTSPNPLNFGNMAWSPELTVVLPISRNGQISRELTVQPRFTHLVNLPVLGRLDVTGLDEVTGRLPINFNNVTPTP